MRNAYAPHSGFKVGAALRAATGAVYAGANVENAAYPQGQCAEASAIGAMVAAGEREIAAVAVVAEQMDVCPPCGGCRQRLAEFGGRGHAGLPRPVATRPRSASCCRCRSPSTHELARGRQAARRARRPRAARGHRARLGPRRGGRRRRGRHGHPVRGPARLPGAERRGPRRPRRGRPHRRRAGRRAAGPRAPLRGRWTWTGSAPRCARCSAAGRRDPRAHQRRRVAARRPRPGPADADRGPHQHDRRPTC